MEVQRELGWRLVTVVTAQVPVQIRVSSVNSGGTVRQIFLRRQPPPEGCKVARVPGLWVEERRVR